MDKEVEGNSAGRPTVITLEVLQKLEQAFAYGATDIQAALYAGIHVNTLYNYCRENPEFADRKEVLKQQPILAARKTVVDAIKSDPALAFKYLERKQKDEFGSRTEIVGANGDPLIPAANDQLEESVNELKRAVDVAIREAEANANVGSDEGSSEADS